jgi:hypothetical protein
LHYARLIRQFAGLVLRRPGLLLPLLSSAWTFRRRDWFRKPPFLPLPPQDYIAWRLYTAYGDEEATPPATDLARYLAWAARLRRDGSRRRSG